MSNFLQLHTLTSYGPSCLNRDDMGRPKTAIVGGVERLRISSQCLKYWWRKSAVFNDAVGDHLGIRTRNIGAEIVAHLMARGVEEKPAAAAAKAINSLFKAKDAKGGDDVIFLFSRAEWDRALDAADQFTSGKLKEVKHDDVFLREDTAVDVALWGRMLAADKSYSREAACQVSHAITTHKVAVEDDYFSAVDDRPNSSGGAGHINTRQFGAGTFYTYVCVDRDLLTRNLNDDADLAGVAIEALVKAVTTVSPGAMQSTMASPSPASYVLAETGSQQPRSLASAFTKPVRGADQVADSIAALTRFRSTLGTVYGPGCDSEAVLDIAGDAPRGSLGEIVKLAMVS
jgi:CRISPR system Cascade subunit CasC